MKKTLHNRTKGRPHLVLPVETKVRELYGKFYLGCVAAERGFRVILGGARSLRERICWLPRGSFFLDKSVAPSRAVWFEGYRKLGLRVVAWCEEGLAFSDDQEYLRRKVDPAALLQVERFFAWGPYQSSLIRRHAPEAADRVMDVGNPRIDILSPSLRQVFQTDVKRLKAEHPRMILINSNFSLCNHKNGEGGFLADLKANGKVKTVEDEQFALGWVAHKQALFDSFWQAIPELSKTFPQHTIVLRPHPSEKHETWNSLVDPLPNVRVVFSGNVVPWLLAAEVIIHNGCTTGLEGSLLERPVLAYQPIRSTEYDTDLPNRVSERLSTLPELVTAIQRVSAEHFSKGRTEGTVQVLKEYIHDIDGGAADSIVNYLWNQRAEEARQWWETPVCLLRRGYWQFHFRRRLKRGADPHVTQKFPGLRQEEVLNLLETFQQVTGRFHDLTVKEYMDGHFMLQLASSAGRSFSLGSIANHPKVAKSGQNVPAN